MLDNLVTLDDIKLAIVLDTDDEYYDSLLNIYRDAAVEALNDYVKDKEEDKIKKNVAKVCILAIVNDMWKNRGMTAEKALHSNVAIQTMLLSLEY